MLECIFLSDLVHRVALARAVYARTKFVLLDDPLSAVVRHSCCQLIWCSDILPDT